MKNTLIVLIFCLTFTFQGISQSMPQLFDKPPFEYVGSELLSITFKTTPEVLEMLVPYPLKVNSENTITIVIGLQKMPKIMDYYEMFVTIPTSYNEKKGGYIPLLYLDHAAPIVGGREIYGFPKVDGDFEFKKDENSIYVSLKRDNETLLKFSATLSKPNTQIYETEKSIGFVVKEIPSVDGSETPALLRLNSYTSRNAKTYDIQNCTDIKFDLFASEKNFMPKIEVTEITSAMLVKRDFILDYGNIEYDYLKNK